MKLKIPFIITNIDNGLVAIPENDLSGNYNGFIRLNNTAKDIMEMLSNDITLEEMVNKLHRKYNLTQKDEIASYVKVFIQTLKKEGLLED